MILTSISDDSPAVTEISLRTINRLLLAEPNVCTAFLDNSLLKCIKTLLHSTNNDIALPALRIVGTLASVCGCIDAIIKSDIVSSVCSLVTTNKDMRWKAVKILKYLSRGSATQVQYVLFYSISHCIDFSSNTVT
jgi:hypothetical protein